MSKGHEVWCESCGCLMKKRRGKFGEFYGCTGYPVCKNTMSVEDAAYVQELTDETANDHGPGSYYEYEDKDD